MLQTQSCIAYYIATSQVCQLCHFNSQKKQEAHYVFHWGSQKAVRPVKNEKLFNATQRTVLENPGGMDNSCLTLY